MKIESGKIVEATKQELYSHYLKLGYDDIYSFPEYLERMESYGVKVRENFNELNQSKYGRED